MRLNLRVESQPDGAMVVSWVDARWRLLHPPKKEVKIFGSLLAYSILVGIIDPIRRIGESFVTITLGVTAFFTFIVVVFWVLSLAVRRIEIPSKVIITDDQIFYEEWSAPTIDITRFDYGDKETLTGEKPKNENHKSNIVRVWIKDSYSQVLSDNTWSLGANHEIRDALDAAWREIKDRKAKTENEAKYGQVTDDGVPDYD